MPRFRIAWLMAAVAFVALDFAAIRALFGLRDGFSELVGLGVLPMANLLAIVAVVVAKGRGSRPFLVGFVASGAAATLSCFAWSWLSPDSLTRGLVVLLIPIAQSLRTNAFGPTNFLIAGVLLSTPQLALALLGGGLSSVVGRRKRASAIGPEPNVGFRTSPSR